MPSIFHLLTDFDRTPVNGLFFSRKKCPDMGLVTLVRHTSMLAPHESTQPLLSRDDNTVQVHSEAQLSVVAFNTESCCDSLTVTLYSNTTMRYSPPPYGSHTSPTQWYSTDYPGGYGNHTSSPTWYSTDYSRVYGNSYSG